MYIAIFQSVTFEKKDRKIISCSLFPNTYLLIDKNNYAQDDK